jgi:hypothetical protein
MSPELRSAQCFTGGSTRLTFGTGVVPWPHQNRSSWSLDAVFLRGENIAEGSMHEERFTPGNEAANDHNRTRSYFTNTILRRATRDLYFFTRAVAANCLCVRIGRTLEKPLLFSEVLYRKIFQRISLQQADQQCCCR